MKLKRWAMVAMGLALLLSGRVRAADDQDRIRVRLNYWIPVLDGRVRVSDRDLLGTGVKLGTTLDIGDDLKLDGPQYLLEPEIQVQITRRNNLIFSYFAADIKGSHTFAKNTAFAGVVFTNGASFNTELKESRLKAVWAYSPLMGDRGLVSLRIGFEEYWFELKYSGHEAATGMHVSRTLKQPVFMPIIGLDGQLNLVGGLGLYGTIDYMNAGYQRDMIRLLDLEGGVRWKYRFLYVGIGYRELQAFFQSPDPNDILLDARQAGWLGTVGVQF